MTNEGYILAKRNMISIAKFLDTFQKIRFRYKLISIYIHTINKYKIDLDPIVTNYKKLLRNILTENEEFKDTILDEIVYNTNMIHQYIYRIPKTLINFYSEEYASLNNLTAEK